MAAILYFCWPFWLCWRLNICPRLLFILFLSSNLLLWEKKYSEISYLRMYDHFWVFWRPSWIFNTLGTIGFLGKFQSRTNFKHKVNTISLKSPNERLTMGCRFYPQLYPEWLVWSKIVFQIFKKRILQLQAISQFKHVMINFTIK